MRNDGGAGLLLTVLAWLVLAVSLPVLWWREWRETKRMRQQVRRFMRGRAPDPDRGGVAAYRLLADMQQLRKGAGR